MSYRRLAPGTRKLASPDTPLGYPARTVSAEDDVDYTVLGLSCSTSTSSTCSTSSTSSTSSTNSTSTSRCSSAS